MDFSFSEEQQLLRDSVTRFIRQDYTFESRQKTVTSSEPFNRLHWQQFAELGWLLVPFTEEDGGLGGSDFILRGHKTLLLNGAAADTLVVSVRIDSSDGVSLLLVDASAPGVTRNSYKTVDGHSAAEIYFDQVRVPKANLLGSEGESLPVIEKVIDRATLSICAEAVGAMESALEKTVEYTRTRKQFGSSLSSFQALQHRMADMFIECQQARSILMMAAMQLDAGSGLTPKAVSAAKSRIGKAARKVGQEAVQLHGGIGVTDELDVAHLFKRLTSIQYLFGSTDYHTQRFISA